MRHLPRLLLIALLPAAPLAAQQPAADDIRLIEQFRPMPFHQIAEMVSDRYVGRIVGAQTRPPSPEERALGAELVYEFRLLTAQRNLLVIRIDARDGRFLEVAGRGQLQAQRRGRTTEATHDDEDDDENED